MAASYSAYGAATGMKYEAMPFGYQSKEMEWFPLSQLGIDDQKLTQFVNGMGLTHFPLREYSSALSVFLSLDPDTAATNGYASFGANPIKFNDPLGGSPRNTFCSALCSETGTFIKIVFAFAWKLSADAVGVTSDFWFKSLGLVSLRYFVANIVVVPAASYLAFDQNLLKRKTRIIKNRSMREFDDRGVGSIFAWTYDPISIRPIRVSKNSIITYTLNQQSFEMSDLVLDGYYGVVTLVGAVFDMVKYGSGLATNTAAKVMIMCRCEISMETTHIGGHTKETLFYNKADNFTDWFQATNKYMLLVIAQFTIAFGAEEGALRSGHSENAAAAIGILSGALFQMGRVTLENLALVAGGNVSMAGYEKFGDLLHILGFSNKEIDFYVGAIQNYEIRVGVGGANPGHLTNYMDALSPAQITEMILHYLQHALSNASDMKRQHEMSVRLQDIYNRVTIDAIDELFGAPCPIIPDEVIPPLKITKAPGFDPSRPEMIHEE